jgi:2-keto-4-pentenoate hydratase
MRCVNSGTIGASETMARQSAWERFGAATEVMGNPRNALILPANHSETRGLTLKTGDAVIVRGHLEDVATLGWTIRFVL